MKDLFPYYSIGHFINEPLNKTEFEITRFDEMSEPQVDDIHKHTFYEIIWIETGKSRQLIDYRSYDMTCGSLFFISPGQVHEFEDWQQVNGGSIMFTEDFFLMGNNHRDMLFELSFLDNVYANPSLTPRKNDFHDIKQVIDQIYKEKERKDSSLQILQSLLHVLLSLIQRCIDEEQHSSYNKKQLVIFKNFKHILDQHFLEDWTAIDFAEHLNITQHHLNMVVKQVSGKTTSDVIRSRKILEAKRLLSFTDEPISEISFRLNYVDPSYFARTFKAETGISPLTFRSEMSEKYRKR